jgi:hypothetical protein
VTPDDTGCMPVLLKISALVFMYFAGSGDTHLMREIVGLLIVVKVVIIFT